MDVSCTNDEWRHSDVLCEQLHINIRNLRFLKFEVSENEVTVSEYHHTVFWVAHSGLVCQKK